MKKPLWLASILFFALMLCVLLIRNSSLSPALSATAETADPGAAAEETAEVAASAVQVRFSHAPGFYDEPFMLSLSVDGRTAADGTICYTTDGSVPDASSNRYSEPIPVADASGSENRYAARTDVSAGFLEEEIRTLAGDEPPGYRVPDAPVDKCTVIRAVYIDSRGEVSPVATASYFVGYQDKTGHDGLLTVSLVTDPSNLFDYENGIYVLGRGFDKFVEDGMPEVKRLWIFWGANYGMRGRESERPVRIQMFSADDHAVLCDMEAGMRVQGNGSRAFVPRSLNLYARSEYGVSRFRGDFFGTGYMPKDLTLFAGGNDFKTVARDALMSEMTEGLSFARIRYIPCEMFLDGEYWGVYHLAEKYDDRYLQFHYGVQRNNVVMIKEGETEAGLETDLALYEEMKAELLGLDFREERAYLRATELLDMESYLDYFAALIYISRYGDWPNGNTALWRARETGKGMYEDGRWRWMLFDVNSDGLKPELWDHDTIAYCRENDALFDALCDSPRFRGALKERLLAYTDDRFSPARTGALIDAYVRRMSEPMELRSERFFGGKNEFTEEMEGVRRFFEKRCDYIPEMLEKNGF